MFRSPIKIAQTRTNLITNILYYLCNIHTGVIMTQKVQELVEAINNTTDHQLKCDLWNRFVDSNKHDIKSIMGAHRQVGKTIMHSTKILLTAPELQAQKELDLRAKVEEERKQQERDEKGAQPIVDAWHALSTIDEKLEKYEQYKEDQYSNCSEFDESLLEKMTQGLEDDVDWETEQNNLEAKYQRTRLLRTVVNMLSNDAEKLYKSPEGRSYTARKEAEWQAELDRKVTKSLRDGELSPRNIQRAMDLGLLSVGDIVDAVGTDETIYLPNENIPTFAKTFGSNSIKMLISHDGITEGLIPMSGEKESSFMPISGKHVARTLKRVWSHCNLRLSNN